MKFAVITPTVGRDSLRSALMSVKSQTYGDVIHLVIGDGPQKPHVKQWCDAAGARYIELSETGGCHGAKARNRAMEEIENGNLADYLIFLDDDNVFFPSTIERYEKGCRDRNNPPMLYQKVIFRNQFNDHWLELPRYNVFPQLGDWDSLNGCFRADIVRGMRWDCNYNHDYILAQRVKEKTGQEFVLIDGHAGVHF
jgi:glycosyltransferase involved in cell wall biosynthesis